LSNSLFFCARASFSSRHERDDLRDWRWFDIPVTLSLFRSNKFAVVIKDHPAVGVPHFQRKRGGVFEMR
jgi:hypothetical protein